MELELWQIIIIAILGISYLLLLSIIVLDIFGVWTFLHWLYVKLKGID
jgi:hypothetical protein